MLNHFNFEILKARKEVLLTNDLGCYIFLPLKDFKELIGGTLDIENKYYDVLVDNAFITDDIPEKFVEKYKENIRSMKSYLFTATSLHIFAVTNACNMRCVYCQARDVSTNDSDCGKMNIETGRKAIDTAMQSPSKYLTFEFQGGEPLLNFDVVKDMILYSKSKNTDKTIEYTMVTNTVAFNDEMIDFIMENNISLCTSLDGNKIVHDGNRKSSGGKSTYDIVKSNIQKFHSMGKIVGAIETTTRLSLKYPTEIVDEYISNGMDGIFLRSLTPLGFAKTAWKTVGYEPEEYLEFYKRAFDHILDINLNGKCFKEIHATYFLKKILCGIGVNYMELRSPCGGTVGQMSYYHNGNVYTCDEGRMMSESGENAFLLGNVHTHSYQQMADNKTCKSLCAASVIETLPGCCDCVYQPYCGVCPAVTYSECGDIFDKEPFGYRCKIYKGMQDVYFDILREGGEKSEILYMWVNEE